MNYVRFMSINELKKYLSGAVLKNSTDWKRRAKNTGSVGFCFFDDSVEPAERLGYLTGVVNTECVAVFERRSMEEMKKRQECTGIRTRSFRTIFSMCCFRNRK